MKIKGMNRVQLKKIKDEIEFVLSITDEFVDISESSNADVIRSLYLEAGNINQVLMALNASGFKLKSDKRNALRVYKSSDISEIIQSGTDTKLGAVAQAFFSYNCGRCGWTSFLNKCEVLGK